MWLVPTKPPPKPAPDGPGAAPAESPLKLWMLAMACAVICFVAFILMQMAFGVAVGRSVWFEILGFTLFIVFVAAAVGTIICTIGAIVRVIR